MTGPFALWCIAARVSAERYLPTLGLGSHLIIHHYIIKSRCICDGPTKLIADLVR
jgi:hypothetical protein